MGGWPTTLLCRDGRRAQACRLEPIENPFRVAASLHIDRAIRHPGRRCYGRGPQTAGAQQPREGGDQVDEQDEQVAHRHILATSLGIAKLDTLTGLRAD